MDKRSVHLNIGEAVACIVADFYMPRVHERLEFLHPLTHALSHLLASNKNDYQNVLAEISNFFLKIL